MTRTFFPAQDFGTWITADGRPPPRTSRERESYPLTRNSTMRILRIFYGKVYNHILRNNYVYYM
jgi:hypothetical protein